MRAILRLMIVLLLLAPVGLCRAAFLEIDSEPRSLDAWVDGRYLGRTPLVATLGRGEVNLRLAETSRSLYRAPVIDTVLDVGAADTLRLFFRVSPLVSIRSQPFGLPLLRDGRRIGSTPLSYRLDPRSTQRLELLTAGGLVPVDSEELLSRGAWFWAGERTKLGSGEQSRPTRLHRIGRYLMPAVAVVMAAGGLIAEDQADRTYREYLHAADPDEIQARYDQTRRRDRWAAAFWIAAEFSAASAVIAWILPDEGRPSERDSRP